LETDEEELQHRRLQRWIHPVDRLDRVIEDVRRLMLEASEKEERSREMMIKGESAVSGQQKQSRGVDGQLHNEIWDPRGSQPQQQGSHKDELVNFFSVGV